MLEDTPTQKVRRAGSRLRWGLLLLAVAGCVISLVLVHLSLPGESPATLFGAAVCAPTDTVDCDYVLSSRWAKVGPIPTSVLGMAYFTALAVWFAVVGIPNVAGRRWHFLPLGLVSVGACASVAMLYVLVFGLPVWCTWCVAAHVANLLLFALTVLAWPRRAKVRAVGIEAPHPSGVRGGVVVGASVVTVLLLLVAAYALNANAVARGYQQRYLEVTNNADYILWRYRQSPREDIPVAPDDLVIGPVDAPCLLVVFSDFQCPQCRLFHGLIERLRERRPEMLLCVFKHYPMSNHCNEHVNQAFHFISCPAAEAAEAARSVASADQAYAYYLALYKNMSRLDEAPYAELAEQVGIDPQRFAAAVGEQAGRERVRRDIALAHALGVKGAPTVFLNGRQIPDWRIMTFDVKPRFDPDATLALWNKLLDAGRRQAEG
ncbi:MAG: vitamin K epoxide reductase family protein [Planctomycetota bacterium]